MINHLKTYDHSFSCDMRAWASRATKLADHALTHLVCRADTWGIYRLPSGPPEHKPGGAFRDVYTAPSREQLILHFQGITIRGLFCVDPADNCVLWSAADWDNKTGDPDVAAKNRSFACEWQRQLAAAGVKAVIEDSNGDGGYHGWVLWSARVKAATARRFMAWGVDKTNSALRVRLNPELYPKQDDINAGRQYGNFLRLPGRHYKRQHYSAFWDGTKWQGGPDAVTCWLNCPLNDPALIPKQASDFRIVPKARHDDDTLPPAAEESKDWSWMTNYLEDFSTFDLARAFADRNMLDQVRGEYKYEVICPWSEEHTTGAKGACIWFKPGEIPSFKCQHAHCQSRGLREVVGWLGHETVAAYCSGQYSHGDRHVPVVIEQVAALQEGDLLGNGERVKQHSQIHTHAVALETFEEGCDEEPVMDDGSVTVDQNDSLAPVTQSAGTTPNKTRRRGLTAAEIEDLPAPEWLVRRHMAAESLALLVGPPGCGKSFWALYVALAVATGQPLFGEFKVKPGRIAYVYSEGINGLKFRLKAWKKFHGQQDVPDTFRAYPYSFSLMNLTEASDLLQNVHQDFIGGVDLLIIDTLNRNFGSGDENSARDMGMFREAVDLIRTKGRCAVLVVHHTGKDPLKGGRGSTVLPGAADAIFVADRIGDDLKLACTKIKDGTPFKPYTVRFEGAVVANGGDGEPITSAALRYVGEVGEIKAAMKEQAKGKKAGDLLLPLNIGPEGITATQAKDKWAVSKETARKRLNEYVEKKLLVTIPTGQTKVYQLVT